LLFVHIFDVTLGKIHFGSYIWQNPIQLFNDIFHQFLEGVGVCVKAIPSTAAAVKN